MAADDGTAPSPEESPSNGDAGKGPGGKKNGGGDGKGDGGGSDGDGGDGGDDGTGEGGGEDDGSSAPYPAAGRYVYAQKGFEEFCDAASCDRQQLPATQPIDTTYKERSADAAVVVTSAQASDNRFVRTTTSFTSDNALVTEVFIRFSYQGITFSNAYEPDPPVEALRFPLTVGSQWNGEWDARTAGEYRIDVVRKEQVSTGVGVVQAIVIDTLTRFRGEFEGTSEVTFWFDPATKAIVKTRGNLDVDSAFGRYNTEFTTTLRSAPGY